jgi:hypothetical protein
LNTDQIACRHWIIGTFLVLSAVPGIAATQAMPTEHDLGPELRHEKIGQLVSEFVQKSHYRHAAVND